MTEQQSNLKSELIVLVDTDGNEIGTAPKLTSHHLQTPLHKAFSCYIFDANGRFLVTQRALSKKVWPGVWTNSVCGHPAPGESDIDAVQRRAEFELGMQLSDITVILPDYRYQTPPFNGVIENEICPVYAARLVAASEVNQDEVEAIRWMAWDDYARDQSEKPETYSYWAKDQFESLKNNSTLLAYTNVKNK